MKSESPGIVLSGLPLAHPYVGQGVYTLRLIEGLKRQPSSSFVVVAPPRIDRPREIPAENFVIIPEFRSPRQEVIYNAIASDRILRFAAREFPDAVFIGPARFSD